MSIRETRKPRWFARPRLPSPTGRMTGLCCPPPCFTQPPKRPVLWEIWHYAKFLLVFLLASGPAWPAEEPEGLLLKGADGAWLPAALLETGVHFQIRGLVAEVEVRQRFVNNTQQWLEGRYLMPLPERSAVHDMHLEIGGRIIEGEIREKEQARAEYDAAAASGQQAGLVEQNRPNLFQTRVANVGPGETVIVQVSYWQPVDYADGRFSVTLPLTLTPRYSPVDGSAQTNPEALPATAASTAEYRSLEPIVVITADLLPGIAVDKIDSPTHAIDVRPQDDGYRIELADDVVASDRDFVLQWTPSASNDPASSVFMETVGGTSYVMALLVPPTVPTADPLPRELILVIDTSGSMEGTSIEQARTAAADALVRLKPQDTFNVIQFNSVPEQWRAAPVTASLDNIAAASAWIKALQTTGGTELAPALRLALAPSASEQDKLRQVVLITDAAIGNEQALLQQIGRDLGNARLFPIGIGSAPNGYFLREAARLGRGSELLIRDIGEVGATLDRLFVKLDRPALRDLKIDWPAGAEPYPQQMPDLYDGEPLLAVARLTQPGGMLRVTGSRKTNVWNAALALTGKAGNDPGIGRLWAREKLAALQDQLRNGADQEQIRQQSLEVALDHHLVSAYTSLVAVDKTPVRPADQNLASTQFENTIPAGQVAFAHGGTGSRGRLGLAFALVLLALTVGQAKRRPLLTSA